jgi:hypothetical protein
MCVLREVPFLVLVLIFVEKYDEGDASYCHLYHNLLIGLNQPFTTNTNNYYLDALKKIAG